MEFASVELLKHFTGVSFESIRFVASALFVFAGSPLDSVPVLSLGAASAASCAAAVLFMKRRPAAAKRATEHARLALEHEQFVTAAEGSLDAFFIMSSVRDDSGKIVDFTLQYLNVRAKERFHSTESLIGKSYREAAKMIMGEEQFREYCEVATTGVPLSKEFRVVTPQGPITWLRHHVVKLDDGIAITSSDLSELKAIQNRFQRVIDFSDSIFEHAPFSIFATDANGMITAMNLEAEQLTGYSSEEVAHKASALLFHDPEELRVRTEQIFAEQGVTVEGFELIAGLRSFGRSDSRSSRRVAARMSERVQEEVWTFIRRDGTRISVSLAVKVMWNESGARTGMIAIVSDLGKEKHRNSGSVLIDTYDGLTGLIGQTLLEDRIEQAIKRCKRAGTKIAVFTIDLDHFKRINDALGHRVGDEILTIAASRLMERVRSSDTVARIGGDEFIIFISDQTKTSDIEFCAEQLLRAISSPYHVQGHTINVTASVGICIYPEFAGDTENLLRRSEAAMYAAKQSGRHRSAAFMPSMLEDAASRLSMEGALRQALDHNELFIEYQPQVALPSGKVIGMEALLRWRHPRFGLVSPAHFIPMAEKIGLLPDFGTWAMHRACEQAKWIQDQLNRRVTLSVNLSPNQFQQKKLLRSIEESLDDSGLAPEDLEIEIIENTLMIDSTANLDTLQMIRDLGVKLSIDDFGTGFCNFNYLLQYQVDRLKIDQSFVRQAANDANAASVVRTVIAMSHGLGVEVIAEGVETREQLKFLMRRRCDQAQGYFFARPLSPEKFVEAVPKIEAMNLSDPSGERAAVRIAAEETHEFVRPADTSSLQALSSN